MLGLVLFRCLSIPFLLSYYHTTKIVHYFVLCKFWKNFFSIIFILETKAISCISSIWYIL
nr:MAG TPA: hypothetical protein [Caudoviricetes sp.]